MQHQKEAMQHQQFQELCTKIVNDTVNNTVKVSWLSTDNLK